MPPLPINVFELEGRITDVVAISYHRLLAEVPGRNGIKFRRAALDPWSSYWIPVRLTRNFNVHGSVHLGNVYNLLKAQRVAH
jgi:hypothetical protein